DGLPARLVFLILTPDPDKDDLQVKILASIARVMEDEKARREMLEARDRKEMIDIFSAALRRDRMMRARG
ncbi:PTS sugar transporter subunit IIA, partial [candidate division WOR-3 bacterium]|nr:PTS sugar transporter subunit IIA [candidate division WOR-3 bacterium]